ncbi:MAG: hypothetical protein MK089_11530 [Phycisphaerales bacterium]|nr:hypothetical protein [Phycisphaerales bacterium]
MRFALLAMTCLAAMSPSVSAGVHIVPDDHATIQGAIDAAQDGEMIYIREGIYVEWAINPGGKKIEVIGALDDDGEIAVTIDGDQKNSVIICNNAETEETTFRNLRITNGSGTEYNGYLAGGGLFSNNSGAVFENCIFTGNQAQYGGGVLSIYSSLNLVLCQIQENTATIDGGGAYNAAGLLVLDGCWVCENVPNQISGNYQESEDNCIEEDCKDSDQDGLPDCYDPCPTWPGLCVDEVPAIQVSLGEPIQPAITAIPSGGLIMLEEGTYEDSGVSGQGKSFTLSGATNEKGGPATVIDPGGSFPGPQAMRFTQGETSTTRIENLILNPSLSRVLFISGSSPTIANCRLVNGESLIQAASSPNFIDCRYQYHDLIVNQSSARFEDCLFSSSDGNLFTGSQVDFEGCGFINSTGNEFNDCQIELVSCTFEGAGPEFDCDFFFDEIPETPGAIVANESSLRVINCLFTECNTIISGGAIFVDTDSSLLVSGSVFADNKAAHGGAIGVSGTSTATIINSIFLNNCAHVWGWYFGQGGAIGLRDGAHLNLISSTLKNNSAASGFMSPGDPDYYWSGDGGAIALCEDMCNSNFEGPPGTAWIHASTICNNVNTSPQGWTNDQILGDYEALGPNCIADDCDDLNADSDNDDVYDCVDRCPGEEDVDTDDDGIPDCVDQCPGELDLDDDNDGVANCVDLCPGFDDTLDSDGDGIPDGCDSCPGDLDGNGTVGIADLLMVIDLWGTPGGDCDGDGDTDIEDLLVLIGNWDSCN